MTNVFKPNGEDRYNYVIKYNQKVEYTRELKLLPGRYKVYGFG